jgi:sugar phosphate isomerase/epimerase
MYLTGFADEAGRGIELQIAATKELGWRHIEARNIDGKNLHDLPEAEFERVAVALERAGITVNCFGSAIANWGKRIDQPFETSLAEARRAVPRMRRLGTSLIRIMSFAIDRDRPPSEQQAEERFRRLRQLVALFRDAGLTPVHENCMNYGGLGAGFTLELLERVPGLALVFDTGNPVFADDYDKPAPYPKQSSWEFYERVRKHVAYVHVKDAVWDEVAKRARYTFPGEGHGDVRRIVQDLLARGYDGGFSIEPHLAVVAHEADEGGEERARFEAYVEYGRRFMKLLAELGRPVTV